jgi:hypothetical protein
MMDSIDMIALAAIETKSAEISTYQAPAALVVGSATAMVQGGGGMSGHDRNHYYYFYVGE